MADQVAGKSPYRSGFVTLVGRPNVGKSTLLNQLVGRKVAIVSEKPQTTRHRIQAVLHEPGGQAVFLDTPGVHEPRHRLGQAMLRAVQAALAGVDLLLFVTDATVPPGPGDRRVAAMLQPLATPRLLLLNKCDGLSEQAREEAARAYGALVAGAETFALSALTGWRVDELRREILRRLPEGPPYFPPDVVTDQPERLLMAELIRERILHLTREEVPHAVAVSVEEVIPRPGARTYVQAIIYVERESQKGILIGRGGQMLRRIGSEARAEIETLLGTPIYLELRVKLRQGWRNQAAALRELGLE